MNVNRKILVHEHIFCRYRSSYRQEVLSELTHRLDELYNVGYDAVLDLTPYTSADSFSPLLSRVPLTVYGCVGFYLEPYVHKRLRAASTDVLVRSLEAKAARTSKTVKVAALKVATRRPVFTPFEQRALSAVALMSRQTGLPIVTHAIEGSLQQVNHLIRCGVTPAKILISHPEMGLRGNKTTRSALFRDLSRIAESGASICFTDLGGSDTSIYQKDALGLFLDLLDAGFQRNLFLSNDAHWHVRKSGFNFSGAGTRKAAAGFTYVETEVKSRLFRHGISEEHWQALMSENPRRFLNLPASL